MRKALLLSALLLLTACATSSADPADTNSSWRALTRADVEAAYRILHEDHPGASPDAHDEDFLPNLERARRTSLERADRVINYEGYTATLQGFANAVGDRHIGSIANFRADTRNWAGYIVALRNGRYVIASEDAPGEAGSVLGATIISCDRVPVDTFAREKLGEFRAVWSIEAQRMQSAPYLLIDDGNPFVLRPQNCEVELADSARITIPLNWRSIPRRELAPKINGAMGIGEAGYGVRAFAGGMWISLEDLEGGAPAVVEAVRAQRVQLRAAPLVVLDLRGNGGGNDVYGRYIAEELFGAERVAALAGPPADNACSLWRASPRNEARLRELRGEITDAPTLAVIDQALEGIASARAAGRDFVIPQQCVETPAIDAAVAPPQAARGRIVLLTDNGCFSSCLSVTRMFRTLGALHAGQTTNANTHYSEVRVETLPSGLSNFFVLQAVIIDTPLHYGPFEPALRYEGDMADTAALEAWVARSVPRQ
ncbi:hypothetical protein [Terricaulis sp.]|uniref:hypothetical protein n=1 Tax=Terricaulis sp. TaxID=2768686 RepID=UPI003783EF83